MIEVAATCRVRVLDSLEDVAVCALAVNVGVGLGLAMSVDWKKAKARGGEEPKDARANDVATNTPISLPVVGGHVRYKYAVDLIGGRSVRRRRHRHVRRVDRSTYRGFRRPVRCGELDVGDCVRALSE